MTTIITDTQIHVAGATRPGEIVDRRLDGRVLVANPGKMNAWVVVDRAPPSKALMKALKGLARESDIRIVVPIKDDPTRLPTVLSEIEAFLTSGAQAKADARSAAASKAAATRAAERRSAEEIAAREAKAKADAEAKAAYLTAKPALDEACTAVARGVVRYDASVDKFLIETPYDPELVEVIRELPGARWNKPSIQWTVPARSHREVAAAIDFLNTRTDQIRAAEAAAIAARAERAQALEAERREEMRALNARRYVSLVSEAPGVGETIRLHYGLAVVESHGKAWRGDDETSSIYGIVGAEGDFLCYVYHRPATEAEIAAHREAEARSLKRRETVNAASAVRSEIEREGEAFNLGREPEGDTLWESSEAAIYGTRDWTVLTPDGWLWQCQYRGADGDAWGTYNLGYNTRGRRLPATVDRVNSLRAAAALKT